MDATPKLICVVGETAAGKSALALKLAQQFNGEIICADSQTIRRGVDIGTSKPSSVEQKLVPHHLLDIIEPDQKFSAAQFQQQANKAIEDISGRGKLPIMVGGTGLYIDGVAYNYQFGVAGEPDRGTLRPNTLIIGLKIEREELNERISKRVDAMLAAGLESEVKAQADEYGWDSEALRGVGYAQWNDYFEGGKSLAETRLAIIRATKDLAKRQRTWFKRNKSIQWSDTSVKWLEIVDTVTTFLDN